MLAPTLTLSFDLELLHGWTDSPPGLRARKRAELADFRPRFARLVAALERHAVTATFAIVTHLLLSRGLTAAEYAQVDRLQELADCPADAGSPWFGRDLVERLLASRLGFEIGCHSFSHRPFDALDAAAAALELAQSCRLAQSFGLHLRSFVFPQNRDGHRGLLAQHGFRCYRADARHETVGPRWRKAVATWLATAPPRPRQPVLDEHGLVALPPSLHLAGFAHGPKALLRRLPPVDTFRRYVDRGLAATVEEGGVLHFWMHPEEYGHDVLSDDLDYLLGRAARLRDQGKLAIASMGSVADLLLAEAGR